MADDEIKRVKIVVTADAKNAQKAFEQISKALSDAAKDAGKTSSEVTEATGEMEKAGKAASTGITAACGALNKMASAASVAVPRIVTNMKKLRSSVLSGAGEMVKSMAKFSVSPFVKIGSTIGSITKKLSGFFASLKRVAIYRMIRTALRELSQAFTEGFNNLYQYNLLIGGEFAKSLDSLATSALYAKNSLAAMLAPIVNVVAPAVDTLVDRFVSLTNTINEAFAALTGASTWTAALKYPKTYAEAAEDANGAAKALRATLLGFDEINRLDDPNRGSRGSADEEMDYSKMFEEREVSSRARNIIAALKAGISGGDLSNFGKSLGEKIKRGLDSIPWGSIKARVGKTALSIATLINGFIGVPELADSIGETIAEAFNTAVTGINKYYGKVNWRGIGEFIASGINSITTKFDFRTLGATFASVLNAGIDGIGGFVSKINVTGIATALGSAITNFFSNVHASGLGSTISEAIVKAFNGATALLKSIDFQSVGKKIGEVFSSLDWVEILSSLSKALLSGIEAAFDALKGLIKESPVVGTMTAVAIANTLAVALGAPKITSLLSTALMSLFTSAGGAAAAGGAAGGAVSGAATAAGGAAAGGALSGGGTGIAMLGTAGLGFTAGYLLQKYVPGVAKAGDWVWESLLGDPTARVQEGGSVPSAISDHMYGALAESDYQKRSEAIQKAIRGDTSTIATNSTPMKNSLGTVATKLDQIRARIYDTSTHSTIASNKQAHLLKGYANGGYPTTGSIFLAGESGAEIVASSGRGTQVANRDQIAESIASGMQDATAVSNQLLREQNALLRQLLAKDFGGGETADTIVAKVAQLNNRSGRTIVPIGV